MQIVTMPQGPPFPSHVIGSVRHRYPPDDRLITVNVSGLHFQTRDGLFTKYPETLLGDRTRRSSFYREDLDEFFFDRHRPSFDGIFDFYKTGKIRRPVNVPLDVFVMELAYFDMGEALINQVLQQEGCLTGIHGQPGEKVPHSEPRRTIWYLFERPESSILAGILATFSCVITLLSVAGTCFQTLPQYRHEVNVTLTSDLWRNLHEAFRDLFFCIETGCVSWFAFELGIRFYASTSKIKFVKDVLNILDFFAILPYFTSIPESFWWAVITMTTVGHYTRGLGVIPFSHQALP
ncbi:KCNA2 [Branchiostoma lanceolatum]|uniref:KCNA2 protein n=1 Tax=Branchiostoma lanceolatum TaxID=7740 RepID=A0A8J9V9N9_BRALA|nr:KCNA2 [Branchiostoma lanceolatum]